MAGQSYRNQSTPYRLADVAEGRDTVENLQAARARYEGGNPLLTEAVQSRKHDDLTMLIKDYYGGICEAIAILEQEGQQT